MYQMDEVCKAGFIGTLYIEFGSRTSNTPLLLLNSEDRKDSLDTKSNTTSGRVKRCFNLYSREIAIKLQPPELAAIASSRYDSPLIMCDVQSPQSIKE